MSGTPYDKYKGLPAWSVLDGAIDRLVANNDIKETTDRSYIIGYLVKVLAESGIITEEKSRD
jgi:hypothetical protein